MTAKICLDLTPNEMWDRHGGFGRYGYHLLEALLALPEEVRAGVELLAWPRSDRPPMSGAQAMAREVLDRPEIPPWRHRTQRREQQRQQPKLDRGIRQDALEPQVPTRRLHRVPRP